MKKISLIIKIKKNKIQRIMKNKTRQIYPYCCNRMYIHLIH